MARATKTPSTLQRVPKGQLHPYMRYESTPLWKAVDRAVTDLAGNQDIVEDEYHEYIVGYICKVITRRRKSIIALCSGMRKKNNRIAAFELVDRGIRFQLSDDAELPEIEDCVKRALSLDPNSIEVLQEAAHFYDAVVPNARKARKLAMHCRDKAAKVIAEMDGIIKEQS